MARLTRPNGDELSGIRPIIDMLVADHRRDTNQIACLPKMSRALVKVITPALHHQQKLLENVTVFTAMLSRTDLLHHQIQGRSRDFGPSTDIELQFSLPRRFPSAVRPADHSRSFSLYPIFFRKSGQKPIVPSSSGRRNGNQSPRPKDSFTLAIRFGLFPP